MSDPAPSAEVSRLVACRACGNRVVRTARRCPACGAQDPASGPPIEPRARQRRPRASSAPRSRLAPVVVAVAAVVLAVLIVLIALRVSSRHAEQGPAATLPPPAVTDAPAATEPPAVVVAPATVAPAPVTVAPEPPPKEPSRSRGKRDWPFFFKPGDRLTRMGDAKPLGYIMRTVKDHKFDDGTLGPAYVLWTPAGDEQAFDADELERGAKLE